MVSGAGLGWYGVWTTSLAFIAVNAQNTLALFIVVTCQMAILEAAPCAYNPDSTPISSKPDTYTSVLGYSRKKLDAGTLPRREGDEGTAVVA